MALKVGSRLVHYDVAATIGEGGMAEVYKPRNTHLERTVAIRSLPEHFAADPDLRQRFDPGATLAALSHPTSAESSMLATRTGSTSWHTYPTVLVGFEGSLDFNRRTIAPIFQLTTTQGCGRPLVLGDVRRAL